MVCLKTYNKPEIEFNNPVNNTGWASSNHFYIIATSKNS